MISRIEKRRALKQQETYHCLELQCRHFRRIMLCFVPHTGSRKKTFGPLFRYAFPASHGIPFFAFLMRQRFQSDGWKIYNAEEEYARLGLPSYQWRISKANAKYELCDTYPAVLVVPNSITDQQLRSVSAFRSRGRLPVLCWKNPATMATILRCSQPRVGITGARSADDEAVCVTMICHCLCLPLVDRCNPCVKSIIGETSYCRCATSCKCNCKYSQRRWIREHCELSKYNITIHGY